MEEVHFGEKREIGETAPIHFGELLRACSCQVWGLCLLDLKVQGIVTADVCQKGTL